MVQELYNDDDEGKQSEDVPRQTVSVRLTSEQKSKLEQIAIERDTTLSEVIRQVMMVGVKHAESERAIDFERLAFSSEMTLAIVLAFVRGNDPDQLEIATRDAMANLDHYHA